MKIEVILKQSDERKFEFKETIPSKSDLSKTVVNFAKDTG